MKTYNRKITSISIGGNPPKDMRIAPNVGTQRDVKQVFMYSGGNMMRVYDNANYLFDVGNPLHFGVMGGTIDASSQITSTLTHGDGVIDNKGYSGNPVVSVPINYDEYQHSGLVSFVQNESGLAESLSWVQDADYVVLYGAIVIDSFTYSDASVNGGYAIPSLSYHQQLTWASGRTETITSGATILYSGTYVGNDGSVYASGVTTEKARTLITTASVTISNGGKSATLSQGVYQEANYVQSILVSASPSSVPSSGASIRVYATGTLKSTHTIDISTSASWSSDRTWVSFSTISGGKYANIGENPTTSAINVGMTASYNGTSASMSISQAAGSLYGTLYVEVSTSYTDVYLNYTGADILATYAKGSVVGGNAVFSGNSLENWGGLDVHNFRKVFGIHSGQASSTQFKTFTLSATQVSNLKAGTDVHVTGDFL